jgi:hypothetical protein
MPYFLPASRLAHFIPSGCISRGIAMGVWRLRVFSQISEKTSINQGHKKTLRKALTLNQDLPVYFGHIRIVSSARPPRTECKPLSHWQTIFEYRCEMGTGHEKTRF